MCASPHSPPLSSGPPSRTFDPFPPDVERTKSRNNFVWIITNYLNRACPSKSWFSMKICTPSLLLSRTPPSSSSRVLNGQQKFSGNKLYPFNFILMSKKIGKLRLKDNCGCFGKNLLMTNPFRTLSFSGRFLAPSILLHFSSFDKSLILSSRRT